MLSGAMPSAGCPLDDDDAMTEKAALASIRSASVATEDGSAGAKRRGLAPIPSDPVIPGEPLTLRQALREELRSTILPAMDEQNHKTVAMTVAINARMEGMDQRLFMMETNQKAMAHQVQTMQAMALEHHRAGEAQGVVCATLQGRMDELEKHSAEKEVATRLLIAGMVGRTFPNARPTSANGDSWGRDEDLGLIVIGAQSPLPEAAVRKGPRGGLPCGEGGHAAGECRGGA